MRRLLTKPDDVRLSDVEPRFVCNRAGRKGGDIRPHFAPRPWVLAIADPQSARPMAILRLLQLRAQESHHGLTFLT
jgi:hypothetical protein